MEYQSAFSSNSISENQNIEYAGPRLEKDHRKRENRHRLRTLCVGFYTLGEKTHVARLVELSRSGARFHVSDKNESFYWRDGQHVNIQVLTPHGASTRTGQVVWSNFKNDTYTWGMRFMDKEKSTLTIDPLSQFIDELEYRN